MALSTNEGLTDKKFSVKRIFAKIMASKEEYRKDKVVDELVFDSIPDYHKKDEDNLYSESRESEENRKTSNESEEEILEEKEENREQNDNERTKGKNNQRTKCCPEATNVVNISNIKGTVHIGPEYIKTWNTVNNFFGPPEKNGKKKKEVSITPKIEALFQRKDKVVIPHIENLSKHFGESWREIGIKLKLSNGQLDLLENVYKNDLQQISFEILSWWMKKKGDGATLGNLCKKLWESRVGNAREAVARLSDVIHLIK